MLYLKKGESMEDLILLEDEVPEERRITEDAIRKLGKPRFQTIDNNCFEEYIYKYCVQLMEYSMIKHQSKEMAYAINLISLDFAGAVFGNSRNIKLDELECVIDEDAEYLIMHNHPSNNCFSYRDLYTFIGLKNIRILMVIGNGGNIYIIEKSRKIEGQQLLLLRKVLHKFANGELEYSQLIEVLGKYGIRYTEVLP